MKHSLLLLGVVAALVIGVPAYSQYIYMDVLTGGTGNGTCDASDVIVGGTTTQVDVYLDTNHNGDGGAASCSDGVHSLDIFSYDLIIGADETFGSVLFNSWTNALTGYAQLNPFTTSGGVMSVGYSRSALGSDPAGLRKLGTINLTATGDPSLFFMTAPPSGAFPSPVTGFGSTCDATLFANTVTLGIDFFDNCGTTSTTPTKSTTWGAIKNLYR